MSSPATDDESGSLKPGRPGNSGAHVKFRDSSTEAQPIYNIEREVTAAFKGFAAQQRQLVEHLRLTRARNDKETKLEDLKKFAETFRLHTPVPTDIKSMLAKGPEKEMELDEKGKGAVEAEARHAEETESIATALESKPA